MDINKLKVFILCGEEAGFGVNKIPRCFVQTFGEITLLEYTIRLLRILNIHPEMIHIVTGKGGAWKDPKYHKIIKKTGIQVSSVQMNGKRSFQSVCHAIELSENKSDILILNGDRYFTVDALEKLSSFENESVALIEERNAIEINAHVLSIKKNHISSVNDNTMIGSNPWFFYHGAMRVTCDDINRIINHKKENFQVSYIEAFVNLIGLNICAVNLNDQSNSNQPNNFQSKTLSGGSFAGLQKSVIVKKTTPSPGEKKLIDEIKWLRDLPQDERAYFPSIIDYSLEEGNVWYTMPWYREENLRQKILSGKVNAYQVKSCIKDILEYLNKNFYQKRSVKAPSNWLNDKHFSRYHERIKTIEKIQPFDKVLKAKKIVINNKNFKNLPTIYQKIEYHADRLNIFDPKDLVQIHGDLHFQNILVSDDLKKFILADPRGEIIGSDIYYDLGKLWHSVNGKYDLIHTDIMIVDSTSWSKDIFNIKVTKAPDYLIKVYNEIRFELHELLENIFGTNDKHWKLKVEFSEFMHFSSLMYFHLKHDKSESRALLLYSEAIKLGSTLLEKMECYDA